MRNLIISLYVGISLMNCKGENISNRKSPSLEIINSVRDTRFITSVKLVNYEFKSLNIESGHSQTFVLENGMPAGLENINVSVTYGRKTGQANTKKIDVNFKNGKTTTLNLSGCVDFEGCDGHTLE